MALAALRYAHSVGLRAPSSSCFRAPLSRVLSERHLLPEPCFLLGGRAGPHKDNEEADSKAGNDSAGGQPRVILQDVLTCAFTEPPQRSRKLASLSHFRDDEMGLEDFSCGARSLAPPVESEGKWACLMRVLCW